MVVEQKCITREAENKFKYENLSVEIQLMWNMKCSVISIVSLTTENVIK
jgi:hypothetical protein